ncbi:unnamed protein product, partial [Symbiodinium necroappetens]
HRKGSSRLQKLGQQLQDSQADVAKLERESGPELLKVAYCNFTCQKNGWKLHKLHCGKAAASPQQVSKSKSAEESGKPEPPVAPKAPKVEWSSSAPLRTLPRVRVAKLGTYRPKVEDFFDRGDLEPGLAVAGKPKKNSRGSDSFNYSKWDKMGDSDDEGKKTKVFGTSHREPMHGQPMGMTPARNPKADGNSRVSTAQSKQEARSALEEAEKFLHAVAAEVLHQAGTMGPGSVWALGPEGEKTARRCLRILNKDVLPVLPDDSLATFLHGSANYFLRRATDARDHEKSKASASAKASLLQVHRDATLNEAYRENACDFLAALFEDDGELQKAKEMERMVESYRNGEGGKVEASENQPQTPVPSSFAVARSFDSQGCWSGFATCRWQGRRVRQRHIRAKQEQNISRRFEGYGTKDVDTICTGKENYSAKEGYGAKGADTICKAKAIPSIEEVLAQLDREDEEELEELLY